MHEITFANVLEVFLVSNANVLLPEVIHPFLLFCCCCFMRCVKYHQATYES